MALTYVDRSRYITRLSHCAMAGYLNYHYAEIGIQRQALSVPLSTGGYVHEVFETVLKEAKDTNKSPTEAIIKAAISDAMKSYEQQIADRGFADIPDQSLIVQVRNEQTWLVGGLCWTWFKTVMPWLLERYEIKAVEEEFEKVLGCSCGLSGVGSVKDHINRDCNGVVLMTRPDLILLDKEDGSLSYHEFKTGSSVAQDFWGQEYEDNIQFALCTAPASGHFNAPINTFYVHGLHKGYRKKDSDTVRRQVSPFCYAYVKAGVEPMFEQEVRPYWTWTDEEGKSRRCGQHHHKTPVWEIEGVSSVNDWLAMLSDEDLAKNVRIAGPFSSNPTLIEQLLKEMYYEAWDWDARVGMIRDEVKTRGSDESHSGVLALMTELLPRSWSCKPYNNNCSYKPYCFRREGWEDPLAMTDNVGRSLFELREPNHPVEKMSGLWE